MTVDTWYEHNFLIWQVWIQQTPAYHGILQSGHLNAGQNQLTIEMYFLYCSSCLRVGGRTIEGGQLCTPGIFVSSS